MLRTFPISIYTQSIVHAELCLHIKSKDRKKKEKEKSHAKIVEKTPHCQAAGPLMSPFVRWAGRQSNRRGKGPVRSQYLCLYASPGPITAPSNRLFTTVRSWGGGMSTQIL